MKEINYAELLNRLSGCRTKYEIVQTLTEYGIRTSTKPTQTMTQNDNYFQLADKSRIQIMEHSIKLLTGEVVAKSLSEVFEFKDIEHGWDGSYRVKYTTVEKNAKNLRKILEYFLADDRNLY